MITHETIDSERRRRLALWAELKRHSSPDSVAPSLVKELRIHRGQQGVFRDQKLTGTLTDSGTGVAVGLLHTGSSYSDDLYDDGVIYHYPVTSRGIHDRNEIEAIKTCNKHSLPIFVVIKRSPGDLTRNVRLGWVSDYDDDSRQVLITFSDEPPPVSDIGTHDDSRPFTLKIPRSNYRSSIRARLGQRRFRFAVLKRYGTVCAFCRIAVPNLLEAGHLCPVEEGGTDDPRNGLVMCLNHHKAFDSGLLLVHPDTLDVTARSSKQDLKSFGVVFSSIHHLKKKPHRDALMYHWGRFR
jgi:putative restriction endonuclease